MKISIIVPVYNCEHYINDCIKSLINQTYSNFEIIIVNDGSLDNSLKVINTYKNNKKIKIFSQKNSGANKARKLGIDHATGDYIMFVDGDDWIDNETVEYLVKFINKYNPEIIRFNCILEPSKKKKNYYKSKKNIYEILNKKDIYDLFISSTVLNNLCFCIYKKELFSKVSAFDTNISNAEDLLANLELFSKVNNILIIDKILYHYRVNSNSTTKKKDSNLIKNNVEELIYVLNKYWDYLGKWDLSNKEYNIKIAIKYIDTVRSSITSIYDCKDCSISEKNNYIKKVFDSEEFENIRKNFTLKEMKKIFLNKKNKKKLYKFICIKYIYKKKYNKLKIIYMIRKMIGR